MARLGFDGNSNYDNLNQNQNNNTDFYDFSNDNNDPLIDLYQLNLQTQRPQPQPLSDGHDNDDDALLALKLLQLPTRELNYTNLEQWINKKCHICNQDYQVGDILRTLPCFDEFHKDCIDERLVQQKIFYCPVDNKNIDDMFRSSYVDK